MVGSESELGNRTRSESVCVCVWRVRVCVRARALVSGQVELSVASPSPWRPGSNPREGALSRQPLFLGFLESV